MKIKDYVLIGVRGYWAKPHLQCTLPPMIAWLETSTPLRLWIKLRQERMSLILSWLRVFVQSSQLALSDLEKKNIHNSSPDLKDFHKNDLWSAFVFKYHESLSHLVNSCAQKFRSHFNRASEFNKHPDEKEWG